MKLNLCYDSLKRGCKMDNYTIEESDLRTMLFDSVKRVIYKKCKNYAELRKRFVNYSDIDRLIEKRFVSRKLQSVSVDLAVIDTVIVTFHYIDKPMQVVFVELHEFESYHDCLVRKNKENV